MTAYHLHQGSIGNLGVVGMLRFVQIQPIKAALILSRVAVKHIATNTYLVLSHVYWELSVFKDLPKTWPSSSGTSPSSPATITRTSTVPVILDVIVIVMLGSMVANNNNEDKIMMFMMVEMTLLVKTMIVRIIMICDMCCDPGRSFGIWENVESHGTTQRSTTNRHFNIDVVFHALSGA